MAAPRVKVHHVVVRQAHEDGKAVVSQLVFQCETEPEGLAYLHAAFRHCGEPPAGVHYRFVLLRTSETECAARWVKSKQKALPSP